MSAPAAIEVEGLGKRFGDVTAVDGLSFSVARGELFGLVGPDGAGKTTLLRILAGVLRADRGDARISGRSVVRDPEAVKPSIAYMSQRFGLYGDLTVSENLNFYADLYDVSKAERAVRIERLFRFSNLEPFRDRLAARLSGGMKQKLGLSCALIHEPEVLLLDEPTFGVDPISRRDLWLIVHEMVANGVTVIVSTAYMDEAERFDRVAFVHRGRIMVIDSPDALQRAYAGVLVGISVDRPREARLAIERHAAVQRVTAFGEQLHVTLRGTDAEGSRVTEALRAGGFRAGDPVALEPSMEDVFIARVAEAEVA